MKTKALFLDRDGVINRDPGDYTYSVDEFIILDGVMEALKLAQAQGYLIIIITNQGGIAKNLYTEDTVRDIHRFFTKQCAKNGITLSAIYFSPHHPDYGNSLSRKPGALMLERAIARFDVDPVQSVMIGDRDRDLDAAAGAGVRGILMETNASLLEVVRTLA
ncbi:MAG: HAD family hydrolase [Flavobacteriales bacterium]|nr:HAD family hydrolase [Flavobacteriales bacterium]